MNTSFTTTPPTRQDATEIDPGAGPLRRLPWRLVLGVLAVAACGLALAILPTPASSGGVSTDARVTIVVFVAALWAWAFTSLDDTYVALGAASVLVLLGVVETDDFFATLGDDTIWLLVAAFVIAAGVTTSGLATRATAWLVIAARTPRQLVHLLTAAIVVTTFAVPSTSGRAALLVPVFVALAAVLGQERGRLTHALALLFPTVVLLSAVGSLLGAGAHLVASQVVQTATGTGFDFSRWLLLGLPLAVVSSHLAAEIVLWMFTRCADRSEPVSIGIDELAAQSRTPITGPLSTHEGRAVIILSCVVLLWCTAPLHGVHPAMVALVGALVTTSPRYGSTTLKKTLATVPWSLLLFMAATLALGTALITSGAADWVARGAFDASGCPRPSASSSSSCSSRQPRTCSSSPARPAPPCSCRSSSPSPRRWASPRRRSPSPRPRPPAFVRRCPPRPSRSPSSPRSTGPPPTPRRTCDDSRSHSGRCSSGSSSPSPSPSGRCSASRSRAERRRPRLQPPARSRALP